MERTFYFPSALVRRLDEKTVAVRYWARDNQEDGLQLTIDGEKQVLRYGDDCQAVIEVQGPEGEADVADLPNGPEMYVPGIEFRFMGACVMEVVDIGGEEGLRVVIDGDCTVANSRGFEECDEALLNDASRIDVLGPRATGDEGPHSPT